VTATVQTVQGYLEQAGLGAFYNAADPLAATYENIAATHCPIGGLAKSPIWHKDAIANMMARQLIYFKKVGGDCGSQSSYSFGTSFAIGKSAGLAAAGAGAAGSIAGAAGVVGLSTTLGTIAKSVSLIAIPFAVLGLVSAHHAAAVAREQTVSCGVSLAVNETWRQIDAAFAAGQLSIDQSKQALDNLETQALAALAPIREDSSSKCNWGCESSRFVACITDLRKLLYTAAKKVSDTTGAIPSSPGFGVAVAAAAAAAAFIY
jgi:hypothetical protein